MSWADIFSALSTGAQIAGAISSVSNAYRSAEMDQTRSDAQKAANEAQAVVADNNAQLATWQAMDAIYRGQVTENQSRLKTASLKSTQRVRMAANGIALDEGSSLRVLADTDLLGELDAMQARDNAGREAWALNQQATDSRNRAAILRSATVPVAADPTTAALSTALTQGSRLAETWYSRNRDRS